MMTIKITFLCLLAVAAFFPGPFALPAEAAEVIIIGDTQFKPVVQAIAEIKKILETSTRTYAPPEVKGRLGAIFENEGAKVVIALGDDALSETLNLPPSIPVIYGLVVTPPAISGPNTTGFYMATPVKEYVDLITRHFGSLRRMAVFGRRDLLETLVRDEPEQVASSIVGNPFEFVSKVKEVENTDFILLLPDGSLLTDTALEEVFLVSFRRGIPLLGISEKYVKRGSLFALVVDPVDVGGQIGEYAAKVIGGANMAAMPPAPPRKFELYVNMATARKMGIQIPAEIIRMAKRVFP